MTRMDQDASPRMDFELTDGQMAMKKRMRDFAGRAELTKESIIDQAIPPKSPLTPLFQRGEIPPFSKGREGGI